MPRPRLFVACSLIAAAVAVGGCSEANPGYVPPDGSARVDAAVRRDGAAIDLAAPSANDLSLPVGPCGGDGQPCCAGDTCNGGGCCHAGACLASGRECQGGSVCADGACVQCGTPGQPCCAQNDCGDGCCVAGQRCVDSGQPCGGACAQGACGTCQGGSCQNDQGGCGGDGDPCCQTPDPYPNFCGGGGLTCSGGNPGRCESCGGDGDPCCDGNRCDDGGCCVFGRCVGDGGDCGQTRCAKGSCGGGTCGGLGQACCGGAQNPVCTAPATRCLDNSCAPCGGKGQRCCIDWALQEPLGCDPPYRATGLTVMNGQDSGICICN